MWNCHAAWFVGMFLLMMTATDMDKFPSICFAFNNDFAAIHILMIHTIHIVSMFYTSLLR